jgi:transcriptional regulator with XRE-family HTH domain
MRFDPTQDPVEPYVRRLRKEFNYTQDELARESQTSRLAVLRNEHLNYSDPLPNIVTTLSLLTEVPLKTIQHEYHIDVSKRRRYASEVLLPRENFDYIVITNFFEWRVAMCLRNDLPLSIIKFSSMVCVNPSTITDYEFRQQTNLNTSTPASLKIALREMYGEVCYE